MSTLPIQSWRRRIGAAALLLALPLAGCGFHLAGEQPVPPALSSVYIDLVQPYHVGTPPLETALQSRITSAGGEVKSHIGDAKAVLRLTNLSETREILSVGPDGKVNEYRLVTQVTYELHGGGRQLIAPQAQGISHSYSFSLDEILGKEQEEDRLRAYMQDELAQLILLRIEAELARNAPAAPGPDATPPASPQQPGSPAPAPPAS